VCPHNKEEQSSFKRYVVVQRSVRSLCLYKIAAAQPLNKLKCFLQKSSKLKKPNCSIVTRESLKSNMLLVAAEPLSNRMLCHL
jgi:hypothetical protein